MPDRTPVADYMRKAREMFAPHEPNIFEEGGLYYVGRFLDDGWARDHQGRPVQLPPYQRQQEVFGCGPTLADAFRFCDGSRPVYSIPGITPGQHGARGLTIVMNKHGQIGGFISPSGVFTRHFPRG